MPFECFSNVPTSRGSARAVPLPAGTWRPLFAVRAIWHAVMCLGGALPYLTGVLTRNLKPVLHQGPLF